MTAIKKFSFVGIGIIFFIVAVITFLQFPPITPESRPTFPFDVIKPTQTADQLQHTQEINFDYVIEVDHAPEGLEPQLEVKVKENTLDFIAQFIGAGSENDEARLTVDGQFFRIQLTNPDHISEKRLVLYKVAGTIKNIPKGSFVLQLEDSTSRSLGSSKFSVR